MRILHLLLFLTTSYTLSSQFVFANYSKQLLIEPSASESPELTTFHIEEYEDLLLVLQNQLDTDLTYWQEINKDIEKIEDVLKLWNEKRNEAFIENYNEDDCYDIQTSLGILKSNDIITIEKNDLDTFILFSQEIPIIKEITSGEWVKIKVDKNCQSPNPDDCYKACWAPPAKKIFVIFEDIKIELDTLPINFDYNDKEGRLQREIELFPTIQVITDKDDKIHEVLSWEKIDCE